MKKKQPIYMYQCLVCKENFYTEDTIMKHCGKLTQWVAGLDGKGVDMTSPKVKVKVSGHIEMSQEELDRLLEAYKHDAHMGLVHSIPMGYVNASSLEFEVEE